MATHITTGNFGEHLAIKWLMENGFEIIEKNWRYKYFEIDIIAVKHHKLRIIEVKTRTAGSIGLPEDSVSRKKFKSLQRAADEYLQLHPEYRWIQYDILSITLHKNRAAAFFLLEDVFL